MDNILTPSMTVDEDIPTGNDPVLEAAGIELPTNNAKFVDPIHQEQLTSDNSLKHFKKSDFGLWYPYMDKSLLAKIDQFADEWIGPIKISPVKGAIGRKDRSGSMHNVKLTGKVRAIDLLLLVPAKYFGYRRMNKNELRAAYLIAKNIGFTGIGLYPNWLPYNGVHLDVRPLPQMEWASFSKFGGGPYIYNPAVAWA